MKSNLNLYLPTLSLYIKGITEMLVPAWPMSSYQDVLTPRSRLRGSTLKGGPNWVVQLSLLQVLLEKIGRLFGRPIPKVASGVRCSQSLSALSEILDITLPY